MGNVWSHFVLFFSPEERSIRTGAVVHGRQEKEKRRQKEKGSLSEGKQVHLRVSYVSMLG